jgi:hypothetical protein
MCYGTLPEKLLLIGRHLNSQARYQGVKHNHLAPDMSQRLLKTVVKLLVT